MEVMFSVKNALFYACFLVVCVMQVHVEGLACFHRSSCEQCIRDACVWCNDNSQEDGVTPRCMEQTELLEDGCNDQKTSSPSKYEVQTDKKKSLVSPQSVEVFLGYGSPVSIPFEVRIPENIGKQSKLIMKYRGTGVWYNQTVRVDGYKSRTFRKGRHSYISIKNPSANSTVKTNVMIEPSICRRGKHKSTMTIRLVRKGQKKIKYKLKIHVKTSDCECHCRLEEMEPASPRCSEHGRYECGTCRCDVGYTGPSCEFDAEEGGSTCRRPGSDTLCSARGECITGFCNCSPIRANSPQRYSGRYCECDDYSCPYFNGRLCGGNGICVCGLCKCSDGFTGEGCDCPISKDTCVASNGLICNGQGECLCGQCRCDRDSHYNGLTCEDCRDIEESSRQCSEHGRFECGFCMCNPGYTGSFCELNTEPAQSCISPGSDLVCGGQGVCVDGMCYCSPIGVNSSRRYSGRYCECNDFSCQFANTQLCGGNGKCSCGACVCKDGFTGDACDCLMSSDTCRTSSGEICNGHGTCECGQCRCDPDGYYTGRTCEECIDSEEASPKCSQNGRYECGTCACDHGFMGDTCAMNIGTTCIPPHFFPRFAGGKTINQSSAGNDGRSDSNVVCSGRGICIVGKCACFLIRANSQQHYSGRYCQCNDYSCPYANGRICGGHGNCICGMCACNDGYMGDACECPTSAETCLASNREICNGFGECICGVCRCYRDSHFKGPTCEECPTCPGKCYELRPCVECVGFAAGKLDRQECAAKCSGNGNMFSMVQQLPDPTRETNRCQFSDEDGCMFRFAYWYPPGRAGIITVIKTEKDCPPPW